MEPRFGYFSHIFWVTLGLARVACGDTGLDTAWKDAKGQLEEILKGGAAIVSVAQYAAASRKSDSLDYPVVEEQMVRPPLPSLAPLSCIHSIWIPM